MNKRIKNSSVVIIKIISSFSVFFFFFSITILWNSVQFYLLPQAYAIINDLLRSFGQNSLFCSEFLINFYNFTLNKFTNKNVTWHFHYFLFIEKLEKAILKMLWSRQQRWNNSNSLNKNLIDNWFRQARSMQTIYIQALHIVLRCWSSYGSCTSKNNIYVRKFNHIFIMYLFQQFMAIFWEDEKTYPYVQFSLSC